MEPATQVSPSGQLLLTITLPEASRFTLPEASRSGSPEPSQRNWISTGSVAVRSTGTVVTISRSTRTPSSEPREAMTRILMARLGSSGAVKPMVAGSLMCPSSPIWSKSCWKAKAPEST